jgi:hypothetical protein
MPSIEEWRPILARQHLPDDEVEEFVEALRAFIGQFLDDYFRDEFESDEI